ncbi:MAG: 50S ribosomal protein L20 [Candidatus Doudnabacteria bacterium RIFCSPHIGHO2_01_FULL_46_14]|uniref:Large ribosomal subunit protein bL20 n=1 Tax=Candidatus Doudnabacteria bacterium RIFCSPHIGHO2_01_FULL_46_14 TaxID=1817824 RepID=A0A1F5NP54_9BACT|nr:MAG: 50S ribosomal protein L20 [Candidatus Doudnabacteria bacterium RIFCSPHIGHO2_01_FULL_46_14]
MTRVKRGVQKRARRKKVIKRAKGFVSHRKTNFRAANEALMHAGKHAYRGRREKKREFRRLWQMRIGAGAREQDISYSKLIAGLKKNKIDLNRKMLSELAIRFPEVFKQIVETAKK